MGAHTEPFLLKNLTSCELVGACAMTTKFLDNKIRTFKILLSWRFPRKTAFWTIFLCPQCRPPPPPQNCKFYFYCRLAVSELGGKNLSHSDLGRFTRTKVQNWISLTLSRKTGEIKVSTSTVAALFSKMALTGQRIAMVDMVFLVFTAFSYLP